MTIDNFSFETEGTFDPGLADGWTITTNYALEEFAGYSWGPGPGLLGADTFSDWGTFDPIFAFEGLVLDLDPAVYDGSVGAEFVEDFAEGWGIPNNATLGGIQFADYPADEETFEANGWGDYSPSLPPTTDAVYNGEGREDFEDNWGAPGDLTGAILAFYDTAPLAPAQWEPFNSGGPWDLMTTI